MLKTDDLKLKRVKRAYAFWGRFPALYHAQDLITFLGKASTIRSTAVRELDLKPGDCVLEVACGSGSNFPYLIQAVGTNGVVYGVDYSQEMLDAAKNLCAQNGWRNVKLMQGDAARIQLDKKDFDGVLSVLGISAIPGWKDALKRCYDHLWPGGKLVVCDARLFAGWLSFINPIVRAIYSRLATWDPTKDIPKKMKEIFGNVEVVEYNFKTFFIATSIKNAI